MAYTAMYRKKRPKKFGEIVGQPHVVRALTNQIKNDQISHAYLFCGTRGTGKTTAAKIFARAVNCENRQDGEPCNECETCLGILAERNLGVAEIDAASNNGVDNIRDLREDVKYPPTEGRFKVYIIDEVHMLSASAFNALLKTLEEPPPHAVFVLATTDPQKIPATILSRCQRYDFKRITEPDMVDLMRSYLVSDGVEGVSANALQVIAGQSDGALRDALSILDQALSLYNGEAVGQEQIYELLGAVDRRVLFDFTESLAVSDSGRLFEIIDAAARDGRDMSQFVTDLIQHFRNILAAAQTGEGGDTYRRFEKIRPELLTHWLLVFSEAQRDLRYAPNPRTALEITVLRLCSGSGDDGSLETVLARLAKLEAQLEHLIEKGLTVQAERRHDAGAGAGRIDGAIAQGSITSASTAPETRTGAAVPPSSASGIPAVSSSVSGVPTASSSVSGSPAVSSLSASGPPAVSSLSASGLPAVSSSASGTPAAPSSASGASAPLIDPAIFNKILSGWERFCKEFPNPLRSMLAACKVEQEGGLLQIVCDNSSSMAFIKARQKILSEQMMLKYGLSTPINLAFIVRDAYNKFTNPESAPNTNRERAAVSSAEPQAGPPENANTQGNPFTGVNSQANPFAGTGSQSNPFTGTSPNVNPFTGSGSEEASSSEEPPWDEGDDWGSIGEQVDMSGGEW